MAQVATWLGCPHAVPSEIPGMYPAAAAILLFLTRLLMCIHLPELERAPPRDLASIPVSATNTLWYLGQVTDSLWASALPFVK